MAMRYVSGLALAGSVFVLTFALAVLSFETPRRAPLEALGATLPVASGLGLLCVVLIGIGVGPLIARIASRSGARTRWWVVLLGMANGLVYVAASWLVFSEPEDTLLATLRFWTRVPGELLMHLLPGALAGVAFAAWFHSTRAALVPDQRRAASKARW